MKNDDNPTRHPPKKKIQIEVRQTLNDYPRKTIINRPTIHTPPAGQQPLHENTSHSHRRNLRLSRPNLINGLNFKKTFRGFIWLSAGRGEVGVWTTGESALKNTRRRLFGECGNLCNSGGGLEGIGVLRKVGNI